MRKVAWAVLVLMVFTLPWEAALDFGEPVGTIARVAGILLLFTTFLAVLQAGKIRTPGILQVLVAALYLWYCCSSLWSIDPDATLERLRGSFQVMMLVWLLWELAETPRDLRVLLKAYVAGAWVLSSLVLANYFVAGASGSSQSRFVAEGMDPNDAARFLDLALPMAGLLFDGETTWAGKTLSLGYLPLGTWSIVLTASRGGFIGAVLAMTGTVLLLLRHRPERAKIAALCVPVGAVCLVLAVPPATLQRLATLSGQVHGGDLNQRVDIWITAWHVLPQRPFFGFGAGTFVSAAGLSYVDTAHNTLLSQAIEGGVVALLLGGIIIAASVRGVLLTGGPVRIGMGTILAALLLSMLDATVEGNRSTWFVLALIAFAARLAEKQPRELEQCFPSSRPSETRFLPEAVG